MDFVKKIITGFGVGLGFAVAISLVFYFSVGILVEKSTEEAYSQAQEQMENQSMFRKFDENSGLSVLDDREREIDNGVEILARVKNDGEHTWSNATLEVEFFDGKGEFVDECSDYLKNELNPGDTQNVKIKCGGCENNKLSEYDSYTIKVVDASSF